MKGKSDCVGESSGHSQPLYAATISSMPVQPLSQIFLRTNMSESVKSCLILKRICYNILIECLVFCIISKQDYSSDLKYYWHFPKNKSQKYNTKKTTEFLLVSCFYCVNWISFLKMTWLQHLEALPLSYIHPDSSNFI